MNEPRVISLAERRAQPPGIPHGPARLHGLLVSLAPDSYWTGTQAQLAELLREDGETVSDRTIRDWTRWLEERRLVATRAAWRQGMTYFVLGPLPATLPVMVPVSSAQTSGHLPVMGPQRTRETSSSSASSSASRLPGSGSAHASASGHAPASGQGPASFMAGRLLTIGIDPVPELLDVIGRLTWWQVDRLFEEAALYSARTPKWMALTADTQRLKYPHPPAEIAETEPQAPELLELQRDDLAAEPAPVPQCPMRPLWGAWRAARALASPLVREAARRLSK